MQALVFESFEGIEACLAAIEADPDAVIVRVKNRYTRDYDAAETAGYRSRPPLFKENISTKEGLLREAYGKFVKLSSATTTPRRRVVIALRHNL
jgi:hypothetical protein